MFAYLWHASQPAVSVEAVQARLEQLRVAVLEAGEAAEVVLGDPAVLAASDVEDLSTLEEELRTAGVAGPRGVLTKLGFALILMAVPAFLLTDVGWRVDVPPGVIAIVGAFFAGAIGVASAILCFRAARPVAMLFSMVFWLSVVLACVAVGTAYRDVEPLATDVPVLLVGAFLLVPGVVVLVIARRVPESSPRSQWDDSDWLRRFRGALLLQGVSRSRIREQELEVRQMMSEAGATSLYDECGHPIGFARQIAAHDRTAKVRRWGWVNVAQVFIPVFIALVALPGGDQSWTWWRIVIVGFAVLLFVGSVADQWRSRPWKAAA